MFVNSFQVPSHLFEYFARCPDVVRTWARHHRSGEALPSGLLESVLERRGDQSALELQSQILFSAADQVCRKSLIPQHVFICYLYSLNFHALYLLIVYIRAKRFALNTRCIARRSVLARFAGPLRSAGVSDLLTIRPASGRRAPVRDGSTRPPNRRADQAPV